MTNLARPRASRSLRDAAGTCLNTSRPSDPGQIANWAQTHRLLGCRWALIATAATPLTAGIRDDRMPPVRDGLGAETHKVDKVTFRVAAKDHPHSRLWKKVNADSIFMNCLITGLADI